MTGVDEQIERLRQATADLRRASWRLRQALRTTSTPFIEGDHVLLEAKVYRANSEQALIEFVSMEGPFSVRVPLSELHHIGDDEGSTPSRGAGGE